MLTNQTKVKVDPLSRIPRSPFSKADGFTARRHRLSGHDGFGSAITRRRPSQIAGTLACCVSNGTTDEILDRYEIIYQVLYICRRRAFQKGHVHDKKLFLNNTLVFSRWVLEFF